MSSVWWVWRALDRTMRENEEARVNDTALILENMRIIIENQEITMAAIDDLKANFTDLKAAVTEGTAELTDLISKLTAGGMDAAAVQGVADEMKVVATGIREAVAASNVQFPDTTPSGA